MWNSSGEKPAPEAASGNDQIIRITRHNNHQRMYKQGQHANAAQAPERGLYVRQPRCPNHCHREQVLPETQACAVLKELNNRPIEQYRNYPCDEHKRILKPACAEF